MFYPCLSFCHFITPSPTSSVACTVTPESYGSDENSKLHFPTNLSIIIPCRLKNLIWSHSSPKSTN